MTHPKFVTPVLAWVLAFLSACTDEGNAPKSVVAPYSSEDQFGTLTRRQIAERAFATFRTERDFDSVPPNYLGSYTTTAVAQLDVDSRGMPRGIWTYSSYGLGKASEDRDVFAIKFIRDNSALWGLAASDGSAIILRLRRPIGLNEAA